MPVAFSVNFHPRVRRVKLQSSGTKNTLDNTEWMVPKLILPASRIVALASFAQPFKVLRSVQASLPSYANGETCWATNESNTGPSQFVAWEKATCGHRCELDGQQTLQMMLLCIYIYIYIYTCIYMYICMCIHICMYIYYIYIYILFASQLVPTLRNTPLQLLVICWRAVEKPGTARPQLQKFTVVPKIVGDQETSRRKVEAVEEIPPEVRWIYNGELMIWWSPKNPNLTSNSSSIVHP